MSEKRVIQVETKAQVTWSILPKTKKYLVASCQSLGLTVQARTWAELYETIADAINSLLRDLLEEGELQSFLRNQGWKPTERLPRRPQENLSFDVPFVVAARALRGHQRTVHQ